MQLTDREKHTVERLAQETHVSPHEAQEVYIVERTQLELVARIKAFVPLIAERNAKARLRKGH